MAEKPTYEYYRSKPIQRVGSRFVLSPVSHPHMDQENLTHILTSPVIAQNPNTGVIETEDAIYTPTKE